MDPTMKGFKFSLEEVTTFDETDEWSINSDESKFSGWLFV